MLTVIPPKNPSIAVTSSSDISGCNTNIGKVYCIDGAKETYTTENPYPSEIPCMLDEAGCITTDSSKAKYILYQDVKDGKIVTLQEHFSDTDRRIAELWKLIEKIDKGVQERKLMRQKINKELDYT